MGSLTIAPNSESLSIPVNGSFSSPISLGPAGNATVNFTFTVQLVADTMLDYNQNGAAAAADYIVWRKNQGTNKALANDPIGGTIGTA